MTSIRRISARIARENTGKILDILSLSILPLIAAERIAENRIEDFDISRPLDNAFLSKSFLAVGLDEPCLATYYVAAAVAIVLFREFAVSGLRLIAVEQHRVIAAAWSGKIKTAVTMIALGLMTVFPSPRLDLICTGLILLTTVYSGAEYFMKNKDVFRDID